MVKTGLAIVLMITLGSTLNATTLLYQSHSIGPSKAISVTLTPSKSGWEISETTEEYTQSWLTDLNHNDVEWHYETNNKDSKIHAIRTKNTLTVAGRFNGRPYRRTSSLSDFPWHQSIDYSFAAIPQRQKTPYKFWVLRPRDLKPMVLVAKFRGYQSISSRGKELRAAHFTVSLPGFWSLFWKQSYWVDPSSGRLIRKKTHQNPRVTINET